MTTNLVLLAHFYFADGLGFPAAVESFTEFCVVEVPAQMMEMRSLTVEEHYREVLSQPPES
jgi:hypothetical protein